MDCAAVESDIGDLAAETDKEGSTRVYSNVFSGSHLAHADNAAGRSHNVFNAPFIVDVDQAAGRSGDILNQSIINNDFAAIQSNAGRRSTGVNGQNAAGIDGRIIGSTLPITNTRFREILWHFITDHHLSAGIDYGINGITVVSDNTARIDDCSHCLYGRSPHNHGAINFGISH